MKKLFFITLLICTASAAQAQLKVGPHIALPTGDASDLYNFVWGGDVYYMFGNPDAFLNFGAASGFLNFVGDSFESGGQTFDIDNLQTVPIAAAARIVIASTITAGADAGYGFILDSDIDGGFYYRINAGIDIANIIELNAFYYSTSISGADDSSSSLGAFGLNLLFEIGGKK